MSHADIGRGSGPLPLPQVHEAAEAWALLENLTFRQEWADLLANCPWGTVFQSPWFVLTWSEVYREDFDPVVVVGRSSTGQLRGAIFLARNRRTGAIEFAGANQAEYHTFLADAAHPDEFMRAAMATLGARTGRSVLRLHFLAPGTPTGWLSESWAGGYRTEHQTHGRPVMDLADPEVVEAPLRKKKHRVRVARLAADGGGEVRLIQLRSAEALAPFLDEIVAQCDLRQGAVNRSTPFRSDPRKRAFYLRMADAPERVHATVLLAGDRVAAAHIGPISRGQLVLGLIVHSAYFAPHSPGKLLLRFLAEHIRNQGLVALDLTPGEGYKNQYATRLDSVLTVQVYWSRMLFVGRRLRGSARRIVVRVARALGVSPSAAGRVEAHLARLSNWRRWPHAAGVLVKRFVGALWSTVDYQLYAAPAPAWPGIDGISILRRLHVPDLLDYVPASGLDVDYFEFLSSALGRLERGNTCYTLSEGGVLRHYSWLDPCAETCGTGLGHEPLRLAEPGGVLWDDYTHPSYRGRGLHGESIRVRLDEVACRADCARAFAGILSNNAPSRRNFSRFGFVHVATARVQRRLWRATRDWVIPAGSASLFDVAGSKGLVVPDPPGAA